jgi:hypothetical protein
MTVMPQPLFVGRAGQYFKVGVAYHTISVALAAKMAGSLRRRALPEFNFKGGDARLPTVWSAFAASASGEISDIVENFEDLTAIPRIGKDNSHDGPLKANRGDAIIPFLAVIVANLGEIVHRAIEVDHQAFAPVIGFGIEIRPGCPLGLTGKTEQDGRQKEKKEARKAWHHRQPAVISLCGKTQIRFPGKGTYVMETQLSDCAKGAGVSCIQGHV